MDMTIFLAQLWAPALLAIGLGVFVSQKHYVGVYRDIEKNSFACLVFAMIAIVSGVAHINAHSIWEGTPQIIITILGWGLLIKGLAFAIIPGFIDKVADWEVKRKLIPYAGYFMIALGAYLAWIAYAI